ncbi:MAG: hypothetical protein KDC98_02115 [Planctomycetes bacterium]|nr:hypothetical protein [Planctomycetota bacterium]
MITLRMGCRCPHGVPWFSLAVLAACSGGGSDPTAAPLSTFAVLEVEPQNGAFVADRRAEVRVRFAELIAGMRFEDLTVEDAAGPLLGTANASIDGLSWTWRPHRGLPYGSEIRIRLNPDLRSASGARPPREVLGSFRVIDHVNSREHWLGTKQGGAIAAMAWPSGRMAAANGHDVFELGTPSVFSQLLPVNGEPLSFAADDVDGFTALARDGLSPYLLTTARDSAGGNLVGTTLGAFASTFGRVEHVVNARGDAAIYSYGLAGVDDREGLWLAGANAVAWSPVELAPAGGASLRHLAIDGAGNLFVGFIDGSSGRLQLQRYDHEAGASELFDVAELPDEFAVGAMGYRQARVFWHQRIEVGGGPVHLRLSRLWRDGRLEPSQELHRGAGYLDRAFAMSRDGAAIVVYEDVASRQWYLQRFEADGRVGEPSLVADRPVAPFALGCATRGEAWLVWAQSDGVGQGIVGVRSRPGLAAELPRVLYHGGAETIRDVAVGVEDGGGLVVALSEDVAGPVQQVKAVVWQ